MRSTSTRGAFGEGLARYLRLERAPSLATSTKREVPIGVTHIRNDAPDGRLSAPIPREDAWLFTFQLRDYAQTETFYGDRLIHRGAYPAGTLNVLYLERDPIGHLASPYNGVSFYLPRAALDELADEQGAPPLGDLACAEGRPLDDPAMGTLAAGVLPALQREDQVNELFLHHVALAFCAHVLQRYGGVHTRELAAGALAPWQLRRATELMREHLSGELSLARLASECNLPRSQFTRAFKRSTGLAPHRWLLARRVDKAKELMRTTELPLSEIALACGFSEQAHLTRVFSRSVGVTPSAWRRSQWRASESPYGTSLSES